MLTPASRDCLLVKYRLLSHLVIFHSPTLFGPPSALSLLLSASSFSASLGSNVNVAWCLCVLRGAGGFDYFSHKYSVNGNVFDAVVRLLLIAYCCADSVLTRAAPRSCVTAPLDIHNTRQTFPGPATSTRHKHRDASRDRHDWIAVLHHLFIYIQCMSGVRRTIVYKFTALIAALSLLYIPECHSFYFSALIKLSLKRFTEI